MLVLSRRKDEIICIGDNIRLMVVEIRSDSVRLGIEAPVSIPVHRLEVWEAIEAEKRRTTPAHFDPTNAGHAATDVET